MAKQKIETVRELIYWSYANLAMAHSAVDKGNEKYGMLNYMIRAKLFKGLKCGTMSMKSIFDDEKSSYLQDKFAITVGHPINYLLTIFFHKNTEVKMMQRI